jgi:hypothetical protein
VDIAEVGEPSSSEACALTLMRLPIAFGERKSPFAILEVAFYAFEMLLTTYS